MSIVVYTRRFNHPPKIPLSCRNAFWTYWND